MITSGSHDSPVAAILFEEDGSMNLSFTPNMSKTDFETITMMTDYFQYALSREDWLLSFVDEALKNNSSDDIDVHIESTMRSHLRVIEGGKSGTSGSFSATKSK